MTTPPTEATPPTRAMRRVIATPGALSLVAGSMLGVGIFLNPRLVAAEVVHAGPFLLAWLVGGLIALSGAIAYAGLGRRYAQAGGDYVFIREAFGSSAAFAAGWVLLAGVFAGSVASLSVAVCTYQVPALIPGFVAADPSVVPGLSRAQLGGIVITVVFTAISAVGTRTSSRVQTALTVVPVAVLAAVALWALGTAPHATAAPAPVGAPSTAREVLLGILRAQVPIYFAYAGWNSVGYVAGEVVDPARTLQRGLLGGTGLITALYLVLCLGFVAVLGMGGIAQSFEVGTASATALFGPDAAWGAAALIALALASTVNGTVLGGGRVVWAMAHDGIIWRPLAHLGRRFGTPARALWVQAAAACVLVASGTFETLISFTSIAMLVIGVAAVSAWFKLRPAGGALVFPAIYVVVGSAVVLVELADLIRPQPGDPRQPLPLVGLGVFVLLWAGHAAATRLGRLAPPSSDRT